MTNPAVRTLNRLECVGEALRAALLALATAAPEWLQSWVPHDWYERYARRFEEYRLPAGRAERYRLAEQFGRDGFSLWAHLLDEATPPDLRAIPAVEAMRQIWVQKFVVLEGCLQWRAAKDLPPATLLIQTPYDVEARSSKKRQSEWIGYKVHLTESCDDELPHLILNVETTPAPTTDYEVTPLIHTHLCERALLPREHYLDSGCMTADHLLDTQALEIDLIGPVREDPSWQARTNEWTRPLHR